jgi:hypothetical protein
MRHGRSPHKHLQTLCALAVGAGVAFAPAAAAASNHAAQLAQRVATATDTQLVIAMHQQVTPTYAEVTYSDAPRRISAQFLGAKLYSGDINGSWFERTANSCYSTTKERFVGLTSIGTSLLPQGSSGVAVIAYKQLAARELQWTIGANSQHGLEQSTVWFNSRDLIIKAQDRSYKSGRHGTAQPTTVTLTYPKALPAGVPARLPGPACKA